ncbi:aspartate carbamoyltransferase [Halanaerobium congolense]|uniref:Aspartate carbamoyltransferase n=1 Tax=Halanaerobium congolense TaxID=54121 RepID=A0A1G6QB23_9FIRM|nr:aspartate carbamoyltransferase catalytic subunit [Halanaerobium congolense]PTX17938.1 aspartate carbamoyltransferase [Halanaerobium congolense]TDP17280.1 aspartate carbamoyltransferase [Halanaerobium congolense]SDC88865.1 aspartate carbamoyltransferase [Halanaerobium congolense]SDF36274.1 aspartate carbamoyltransferase [Halanaerobium congolense]SES90128.1 aspartate carbamoyltransferase [Halanaerobium congolense]
MSLKRKDFLGLYNVSKEEINEILDTAVAMKDILTRTVKKVPTLRGKTVINLFYEPSTRTKFSFNLAAKRLSADVMSISKSSSSIAKGESLLDTAKTMEVMGADVVVIRHSAPGAAKFLAENISASVLNAGDGAHAHPTQALLDIYSIKEKLGEIAGLKVLIVGDIAHSRVARSNIWGLNKLGAEVSVAGPQTLMPREIEKMDVNVYTDLDQALENVDVVNILRIQMERQERGLFPSIREYREIYGMNAERLERIGKNAMIMHPGPMNRGIEIESSVADSPQSVITEQVKNGVAIRMALLYLLAGREIDNEDLN